MYFLTDRFERHRETFEQVTERMDVEAAESAAASAGDESTGPDTEGED